MKPLYWIVPLIILALLVYFGWSYHESSLSEATKNRVILEKEIRDLKAAKKAIILRDDSITTQNLALRKKVAENARKVPQTRIIYREARAATEARPDSSNMAVELTAARTLIDTQETHIQGLLKLKANTDSLLASKIAIIQNQERELMKWPELVDNLKADHKQEIKKERRRGGRKFLAGVGVGALAVLLIL